MKYVTLKDGIKIGLSDTSVSGYKGASYSPIWTDVSSRDKAFISFVSREAALRLDTRVKNFLSGGAVLHIGTFDDPREAAYAAAKFLSDVSGFMDHWDGDRRCIGRFEFPSDLYRLPVDSLSEIHTRWEAGPERRKADIRKFTQSISIDQIIEDTRSVKEHFYSVYNSADGYAHLQKLMAIFGKDTVKHDWDNLYVTEFQLRYRSVLLAD